MAAVQGLLRWIRSGGGRVDSRVAVERVDDTMNWGVRATAAIDAGSILVALPASQQLVEGAPSKHCGSSSVALQQLLEQTPESLSFGRLGLQLLAERAAGPDAPFAPYIDMLPTRFDPPLPTFWSSKAVTALQYPPVAAQIGLRSQWLLDFAAGPVAAADPALFRGAADAAALGWGMAAASSRSF